MVCPRFCASSRRAKVESPRMSMRSIGSIWQATFSGMQRRLLGQRDSAHGLSDYARAVRCTVSTPIARSCQPELQGVREMRRQTAGRDEHDVKPLLVVAVAGVAGNPELGRPRDAAGLAPADGGLGLEPR